MDNDVQKIKNLIKVLNYYLDAYHNRNESLVSDKEYDELYDQLVELEKTTGIIFTNSPTQTVGYEVKSNLTKVKHNHPLLSLDKTTDINELIKYFDGKPVTLMAKMDGLTCSLNYRDGKLVSAESRGDGWIGEDITHNVMTFVNIPKTLPIKGDFIVDGEAIIDYKTFNEINEKEETKFKNPRNLASGSVRQLDSSVAARRKIKFIAWKLFEAKDETGNNILSDNFFSNIMTLHDLGFEVVPALSCNDLKKLAQISINTLRSICEDNDYPIDGIVATFNDVPYGNSLGMTGHFPKHSIAFKFYQERNETTLLDIEWQTSRTGQINPVAIVEPVEIDGTTVSRASLSNVSVIKDLQLGIGDTVLLIKANQIIPKIVDNLTKSGTYEIPKLCPSCKHPATIHSENGRETLFCTNEDCEARLIDKMCNFVSRQGMNIIGLSRERLMLLIRLNKIHRFDDIYHLDKEWLRKLDGFGKTSADNLINAIEKSRECSFVNFLTAIGIPNIGKSGAKNIVNYLRGSLDDGNNSIFKCFKRLAISYYDWSSIPDIGYITSSCINNYYDDNIDEIDAVAKELTFIEDSKSDDEEVSNKLSGKTFCITGKLVHYSNRDALVNDITANGGSVVGSVSKSTDYLITNDKESGSSKNKKAKQLGISIISEEEFLELIKG